MPEVQIVKPFRESSAKPMRMPGEIVDVDGEMLVNLLRLGIVETLETPAASGEPVDDTEVPEADVEDSDGEPEEPQAAASSNYPPLPDKTAPVSEWEEYARSNEISLTGLRNRNEKMGYIQKVVSGK